MIALLLELIKKDFDSLLLYFIVSCDFRIAHFSVELER